MSSINSSGSRRVLVIAPHGLDEVLGSAGTVARHVDEGDEVNTIIVFGEGAGADAKRRENALEVSKLLGSNEPIFFGFPENRSDTVPLLDVISKIEKSLKDLSPDLVYINHAGNLNLDHQNTFKAAITAMRPVPGFCVREIYSYETLSSTDWMPMNVSLAFQPSYFIDISGFVLKKTEALRIYGGDVRPSPHSRSVDSLMSLATVRGHSIGLLAAESFMPLRSIR